MPAIFPMNPCCFSRLGLSEIGQENIAHDQASGKSRHIALGLMFASRSKHMRYLQTRRQSCQSLTFDERLGAHGGGQTREIESCRPNWREASRAFRAEMD